MIKYKYQIRESAMRGLDSWIMNVPEHIKSDPRNNIMLSFFNMYGQHFDLLFQYASHISKISDRYNIDKGKINLLTDEIKSVIDKFEFE